MSVIRRGSQDKPKAALIEVPTLEGLPPLDEVLDEMDHCVGVLMGRVDPPWENGVLTMREIAYAYYARACEIEGLIYRGERNRDIATKADSPWYKFRTGELQSYLALFKRAFELGGSRITAADNERFSG